MRFIQIHPSDNVAVALENLKAGENAGVILREDIGRGHKFALRPIRNGENIVKYGMPIDADFVADVRFLPNPFWVPSLRELTGHDKPVADYVLSSKGAKEFLDAYEKAIEIALEGYAQEDKHYVTIAVGCTGGQHRSVAMSEELARRLRAHGLNVTVSAREQHKRHSS